MTVRNVITIASCALVASCAVDVEDLSTGESVPPHLAKGGKADFGDDSSTCAYQHQASNDITVLSARISGRFAPDTNTVPADFNVPVDSCNIVDFREYDGFDCQFYDICEELTVDCTNQLERMTGLTWINDARFDNVLHVADFGEGGGPFASEKYYAEGMNCSVLEIRTVSRADALPHAVGMGFYMDGAFTYFDLRDVHPAGEVTLANGERGVIHEFGATTLCWAGSISSSMRDHEFKPFLRFDAEDTDTCYFNWDRVESNYVISSWTREFDRAHELLQ